MLTNKLISYYNHLLATTVLYVTIVEPLQELSNTFFHKHMDILDSHIHHVPKMVMAHDTYDTSRDYYEILGVQKDATKHEIHRAFRQLAKKYHPDKNKEKGAQDEFIKIFKAYETLSDEKKRKEYDNRANTSSNGSSNGGWQTTMHDFDMNEFFKQYEDQFLKHAQHFTHHDQAHQQNHNYHHHQHHHSHHDQFSFHGVNLDDLFHDIDEDEFQSFGRMFDLSDLGHNHIHSGFDGSFGDGESYFGSHFPSQLHNSLHQQNFHQHSSGSNQGSYSCQTITKQVNGIVMTQTSCN